ncbi:MAG: WYL domain-containing protein [Clostridiales bacterium]|nr:WYL domain-containing protein [Candidatus Crickella caballi]
MSDNRSKLTCLMKILYEMTDEDHALDTYRIIDELESRGCGRIDRKTIDPNIAFLRDELGWNIEKEKGSSNRYKLVEREFELAELKLLVDAVQSSRFISDRNSKEIIRKLKTLTSRYQSKKLDRNIVTNDSFKRDSSTAIYSIDEINEAIKEGMKVRFYMVDYDMNLNEVKRYGGQIHEVSPYALMWNNDYYYMLGKPIDDDKVRTYRVDRMRDTLLYEDKAEPRPADFNLEKYSGRVFDMFTGTTTEVELDCKDYTINYLVDRFGKEFKSKPVADDRYTATVTVDIGPTFFAWVFQFGGDIRIVGPEKVREEFKELIARNE